MKKENAYILTQEQAKWAWEKHIYGHTYAQIGDALYCSGATVRNCFIRAGLISDAKRELPPLVYKNKEG
jgi:ParB-like chromosome segregation protein Spo0J